MPIENDDELAQARRLLATHTAKDPAKLESAIAKYEGAARGKETEASVRNRAERELIESDIKRRGKAAGFGEEAAGGVSGRRAFGAGSAEEIRRATELGSTPAGKELARREQAGKEVGTTVGTLVGAPFGPVLGGLLGGGAGAGTSAAVSGEALPDVAGQAAIGAAGGAALGGLASIPGAMVRSLRNTPSMGRDVATMEAGGGGTSTIFGVKEPPSMAGLTKGPAAPLELAQRHAPGIVKRVGGAEAAGKQAGEEEMARYFASEAGGERLPSQSVLDVIDRTIEANIAPTGAVKDSALARRLTGMRNQLSSKANEVDAVDARQLESLIDQADEMAHYGGEQGLRQTEKVGRQVGAELRQLREHFPGLASIKRAQERELGESKSLSEAFRVPRGQKVEHMLGDRDTMMAVAKQLTQLGSKDLSLDDPVVQAFVRANPEMKKVVTDIAAVAATTRIQTGQLGGGPGVVLTPGSAVPTMRFGRRVRLMADPLMRGLSAGAEAVGNVPAAALGAQEAEKVYDYIRRHQGQVPPPNAGTEFSQ